MSIWGKVIGGFAGFAIGGPLGGLMGAAAGHAVDRMRRYDAGAARVDSTTNRQMAFTIAVIVLSAKMAKADGVVTRNEVEAFKQAFRIPPDEMTSVGRIFDHARQDAMGYEPYAQQVAQMFAGEPAVLDELLGGLFHIANADGGVGEAEMNYLRRVASIFDFDESRFDRVRAASVGGGRAAAASKVDPYAILGLPRKTSDATLKSSYRKLIRQYHPDTLIAQGLPQEFIDLANEKMAAINGAYDQIRKERGLS